MSIIHSSYLAFCNRPCIYCSARDCELDPEKVMLGDLGRMLEMGLKLPWLCAFMLHTPSKKPGKTAHLQACASFLHRSHLQARNETGIVGQEI